MRNHLVQIDALDASGAAATVRMCSVDDRRACHLDNAQWVPAIARLPVLAYDFFGGSFDVPVATPGADLELAVRTIEGFAGLRYASARIRLWRGELGAGFGAYQLLFDGRVAAEPETDKGRARLTAKVDDSWLDEPLLETFTGAGGIEGGTDLEGAVRPLILGQCRFAPGTLIDAVDNVYRLSAYGPIDAVTAVYDRLVSLGPSMGNYASLSALLAADIPGGRWATCLAQGLVRLGAPPDGKICFDVRGDITGGTFARKPGAVIARIAALKGGAVDAASLTALDAVRAWNLSLVINAQTTPRQVIAEIAGSVAAMAAVSWTGVLFAQPLGIGTPTLTLDASGRAQPVVAEVERAGVAAPFWRLATKAEISWVVHDLSEIASEYMWRGAFSATRTYRLDDAVTMPNQSAWAYIAELPSAGHAPPDWPTGSNQWWKNIAPPISAAGLTYEDGTPIEDLKPAQPGADVTGENTANDTENVNGTPAAQVIFDIGTNAQTLAQYEFNHQSVYDYVNSKLFVSGQPVNAVIVNEQNRAMSAEEALAEDISLIGARNEDGSAFILNLNSTRVAGGQSLSSYFVTASAMTSVNSQLLGVRSSIDEIKETVVTPQGGASATATLRLDVNGRVVGTQATNNGQTGIMTMVFDAYNFLDPNGASLFQASGGVVRAPNIEVEKIKFGAVDADSIDVLGISKTYSAELLSNKDLPSGGTITVLTLATTKDRADSAIEIAYNMRMRPGHDYAGYFQLYRIIGGTQTLIDTAWYWRPSVVIAGLRSQRGTEAYFRRYSGFPAGPITYRLDFAFYGSNGDVGFIEAGSPLNVKEQKR